MRKSDASVLRSIVKWEEMALSTSGKGALPPTATYSGTGVSNIGKHT